MFTEPFIRAKLEIHNFVKLFEDIKFKKKMLDSKNQKEVF